jgi:hypothetical protein
MILVFNASPLIVLAKAGLLDDVLKGLQTKLSFHCLLLKK